MVYFSTNSNTGWIPFVITIREYTQNYESIYSKYTIVIGIKLINTHNSNTSDDRNSQGGLMIGEFLMISPCSPHVTRGSKLEYLNIRNKRDVARHQGIETGVP